MAKDIRSRVTAALSLTGAPIDLFIVHRDSDSRDCEPRRQEIAAAMDAITPAQRHIPVVPIQATESWLLLDEGQIRMVAGNPKGRIPLGLPSAAEVERRADPKKILAEALTIASNETGRRRERIIKRFSEHRRRLLGMLDLDGPLSTLSSFQMLVSDVNRVPRELAAHSN